MKKIGKEVLFLRTGEGNPRNGEGTFARLKDGRLMHLYTEYCGDAWVDHAVARLTACYSCDEGESWTEPAVYLLKDEKAENIMSPSLFRMKSGELGMVYLRKECKYGSPSEPSENGIVCMPMFIFSADEGKSWSEPIVCGVEDGYYCAINDGVAVQEDGRILLPMSHHGTFFNIAGKDENSLELNKMQDGGSVVIAYSDDCGRTWGTLAHRFFSPYVDSAGLGEPGVYVHENGDLWMYCRTAYGHQYQSYSRDGGTTWTPIAPNFCFTSPDAPMRVKKVGKYTVAVFNPLPYNCLRTDFSKRGNTKRTPFVCAVSTDDGHSFDTTGKPPVGGALAYFAKSAYLLEDDYRDSYCYPSIIEVKDGFLVAYYHSNGSSYTLNSTKMVKVLFSELED